MSDNKINAPQNGQECKASVTVDEFYKTIQSLYESVVKDVHARLQALKGELNNELKYTSAQINAFCEISQRESAVMVERNQMSLDGISNELKYGYQQNQMIHEDLVHLVGEDLMKKIDTVDGKLAVLKELEKVIPAIEEEIKKVNAKVDAVEFPVDELKAKIDEVVSQYEKVDYDKIAEIFANACSEEDCEPELVTYEGIQECIDYNKIEEASKASAEEVKAVAGEKASEIIEKISAESIEQTNSIVTQVSDSFATQADNVITAIESRSEEVVKETVEKVTEQTNRVLDAILNIEMPENIDYEYLATKVSEKVVEMLQAKKEEEVVACACEEVTEETVQEEVAEEVAEEATEEVGEEVAEETVEETTEEVAEEATEEVAKETVAEECVEKCAVVEEEKPEFNIDELVERLAEKVIESLPFPETESVDYDRIGDIVAEKAPLPEGIDYERLADTVLAKMPVPEAINYDALADAVIAKMPVPEAINYDALSDAVIAKMPVPSEPEKIDYDALSDMIVAKMPKPVEPKPVDYETLAEMVTAKLLVNEEEKDAPVYDVVLDEEGVDKVAEGVFERLDLDVVAEKLAEKMPTPEKEEINYELLADMVADRLAVKVEILTEPVEEVYEETVEEATEEVVEETTEEPAQEEVVEEVVEETVEEVVAEEVVEEVTEEPAQEEVVEEVVEETAEEVAEVVEEVVEEPAQEEVAATVYESEDGELINAETGLVLRLKRSFSAKLKQSDENVKVFYDQIKNELVSYKKVKSTVSWHGDRFNLGRATVAKMNICGKTLCFYVALDPADPELKETVYHQKNVGEQKAYQATPFKVKVKSDMGAKRAVRLVGILADKIGATKKENFVPTDYVEEFAYETTQELLEKGLIKETQEKKIDFEF